MFVNLGTESTAVNVNRIVVVMAVEMVVHAHLLNGAAVEVDGKEVNARMIRTNVHGTVIIVVHTIAEIRMVVITARVGLGTLLSQMVVPVKTPTSVYVPIHAAPIQIAQILPEVTVVDVELDSNQAPGSIVETKTNVIHTMDANINASTHTEVTDVNAVMVIT